MTKKALFHQLTNGLRFQLKFAKIGEFWADEVASLELNLGSVQNVKWDAISQKANLHCNSKSGSRSLVMICMGRYTVFLSTFEGFLSFWRLWKSPNCQAKLSPFLALSQKMGLRLCSFGQKSPKGDFWSIKAPETRGKAGPGPFSQKSPNLVILAILKLLG